MSLLTLLLSLGCIQQKCSPTWHIPYQDVLHHLFLNVTHDVWNVQGIAILLALQAILLIAFFGIGLYLGLKILPTPLSELERKEIIQSPYTAFNKIIFSKALFRGVNAMPKGAIDLRNKELRFAADLYLLNFKLSNKVNWFFSIFFFLFVVPSFLDLQARSPYAQLFINFLFLNLSLLFLFDLALFTFSKLFVKGRKNV